MQVHRIQNNNSIYFSAKLKLSNSVTNMPERLVEQIRTTVDNIGNDRDAISVRIGEKYSKKITWNKKNKQYTSNGYHRMIVVTSYIDGKIKQKSMITVTKQIIDSDIKNIGKKLIGYLKTLDENNPTRA